MNRQLDELFVVAIQTTNTCSECKKKKEQRDNEYQLIINCHGDDINKVLDEYFASESRSDIYCRSRKCKGERREKRYDKSLLRGPDILCTQFSRFEPNEDQSAEERYKKNTRSVPYGQTLNLSRFVKNDTALQYRLVSIVHHSGELGGGHYITTAETPRGSWAHYNNETVTRVSPEKGMRPGGYFTPYLLFWQKEPLQPSSSPHRAPENQRPMKPEKRSPEKHQGATKKPPTQLRNKGPKSSKKSEDNADPSPKDFQPSAPNSKKRPQEAEQGGRVRSKSPKTDRDAAETPPKDLPSNPPLLSGVWPDSWLFGNSPSAQNAEHQFATCKEQQDRKDQEIAKLTQQIKEQRDLIHHAAVAHVQLMDMVSDMNAGLEASKRAIEMVSPLMHRLKNREQKSGEVTSFLKYERCVQESAEKSECLAKSSPRYKSLVEVLKDPRKRNSDIEAFLKEAKEAHQAKDNHELGTWLDGELKRLDLPDNVGTRPNL